MQRKLEVTGNYQVSAAASAVLGFATLASYLEGGRVSFYLDAALTLITGGIAINQYGPEKAFKDAKAFGSQALQTGMGFYSSYGKKEKRETLADAVQNSAPEAEASQPSPKM